MAAELVVNLPVDVKGVLEDACAVSATMVAALLGVDGVVSGAGRSDDTSGLSSVHVDADLGVAVGGASGWLVV